VKRTEDGERQSRVCPQGRTGLEACAELHNRSEFIGSQDYNLAEILRHPMKIFSLVSILVALATLGQAATDSRQALIDELTQLLGFEEVIQEAKNASRKQGSDVVDQSFAQLKSILPESADTIWTRIKAAADNLGRKIDASWSVQEAIRVWQKDFVTDFSEAELREIIAQSKTPLGRKQITAGMRANRALQDYLVRQTSGAIEGAVNEYVAELQRIMTEAKEQPAN
jgi:hypothetical protein